MVVRDLLAEARRSASTCGCCCGRARRCRVFQPSRRMVRAVRDELCRGRPIRVRAGHARAAAALPSREDDRDRRRGRVRRRYRPDRAGRRPPRLAAATRRAAASAGTTSRPVRGPVVADVAAHFALRWRAVTGERLRRAPSRRPRRHDRRSSSCAPCPRTSTRRSPRGSFGILETLRPARSARPSELIYLESQYLWSPEIVQLLADKLRQPPSDRFRLLIVLPGAALRRRRRHARRAGRADRGRRRRRSGAGLLRCTRRPGRSPT